MKECDPNKDSLNLGPKQSVCNDSKHRCAALSAVTESVPNDVRGIQRFCSHTMEIPTTHGAALIPHGGTHTPAPIIFPSLCLSFQSLFFIYFFLSGSLTFSSFQAMYAATGLFF